MLYVVGLGLSDEYDITLRGLEAVKKCKRIYLESYTSILLVEKESLEKLYGKEIIIADRETVESESDGILANADVDDVAFLVVGDPFGATTHTDLALRAKALNVPVQVIHNASIMNAAGACGLQLYNFGQTISMVFFTDTWRPDSWYDKIKENSSIGLHTLCLLDIKVKEQSIENMARGRKLYEPPRYMTVSQAAKQLLEIEENRKERAYTSETIGVSLARVGSKEQKLVAGSLAQLATDTADQALGPPLHSLVLVGSRIHPMEAEYIRQFALVPEYASEFERVIKDVYGIKERWV